MNKAFLHKPASQFVPMFHRYQCRECHSWIHYDEWTGRWWHKGEDYSAWFWDGAKWALDNAIADVASRY